MRIGSSNERCEIVIGPSVAVASFILTIISSTVGSVTPVP